MKENRRKSAKRTSGCQSRASAITNLRASSLDGVFHAGFGGETYFGPIGLRVDVGDEMYFLNGAHHNLRITFGPTIRF